MTHIDLGIVGMPTEVAHRYEHLGIELLAFAQVFRPDHGRCFDNMAKRVRELSRSELPVYEAMEIFHGINAAGAMALERLISWHRQLPERGVPWLPYEVSEEEAAALSRVANELEELDRSVKETGWRGLGGGVRFTQTITSLRSIAIVGTDLFRFNAGFGALLIQFSTLALHHP